MSEVRKSAVRLLCAWEKDGKYINLSLDGAIKNCNSASDAQLLTAIVYGTVERKITLDYIIGKLSARPAESLEPHTRNVLRTGLYQLIYMDRIPAHAAVNESVKLGKSPGERAFINGVLRSYTKNPSQPLPEKDKNPIRYLSVAYSFPREMCRWFCNNFGYERTENMFRVFNGVQPLTLRANTLKIKSEELAEKTGGKSVDGTDAVILSGNAVPRELYGYCDGLFYVQDLASQYAVSALEARAGDTVIDVCACPGGKSFGAAMYMENTGKIYSFDLHGSKLPLIESGAKRLSIDIIEVIEHDSELPYEDLKGKADRVICDVPCSGLGVMGKKPDLRYRNMDDISELPQIQGRILESAATYLKKGGVMVYSTCTVNPAENEGVTDAFLANHTDFSGESVTVAGKKYDGGVTLYPDTDGTDGFYICKMKRTK